LRHAAAIILDATYGYEIGNSQDEVIHLIELAAKKFGSAAVPGAHLVDTFPWSMSALIHQVMPDLAIY
jgi:hypothetical protein